MDNDNSGNQSDLSLQTIKIKQTLLNPNTWFLLIAFLIPLGELPKYFGAAFSGTKIISLIILFLALAYKSVKKEAFLRTPLDIPILFFIFSFLPSVVRSSDISGLLLVVATVIGYLLLNTLVVNFVVNRDSLKKIVLTFLISLLFVSVLGLAQFFTGLELLDMTGRGVLNTWEGIGRVLGTTKNPNAFATYFIVGISLAFALLFNAKEKFYKFIMILLISIYSIVLLLTLSRGAISGVIAGLFVIFLFFFKEKRTRFSLIFTILILGFILFIFWPSEVNNRLLTIFAPSSDAAIVDRFSLLESGISMFLNNLFFGVGYGNFMYELSNYGFSGTELLGAHSTFLGIAAELGLIGFIPFILIILIVIKTTVKGIKYTKDPQLRGLLIGLLGSFIGLLVMGITHENYINILLWFVASLCIAGSKIAKRSIQNETYYNSGRTSGV